MAVAPRRVLVTGAASGIGRRLVGDLLAAGHRVVACDLTEPALTRAASEDGWPADEENGRVRFEAFDVRDADAWDAAITRTADAWGGLDVAMNVAGYLRPAWLLEVTDEDVDRHYDINVKGVVLGTRAAARHMVEQGGGHIVNIASMASLAPIPGIGLYSSSKYAVRGFSLAAADELRPHRVHVTVVCPDAVRTPMLDLQLDYPEAALTFTAPKFLEAADVSRLILGKVLRKKPLLVSIPKSRALLARLADLLPATAHWLRSMLERKGLAVQKRMQGSKRDG